MKQLLLIGITLACSDLGRCDTVLSPFGDHNPIPDFSPFLVQPSSAPSVRYQQVYQSSDFTRFFSSPVLITEIRLDNANTRNSIDTALPNVQINFSTTSRAPDTLSGLFSDNVGANNAIVFSGPLHLLSSGSFFEVHIPLQTPFIYDPSMGNLLLDVRNFVTANPTFPPGPNGPGLFTFEQTLGDTVSSIIAFDVNAPMATSIGTAGLLTLFTVTAV